MTDQPRTIAERYEVVRQLGRGGFATTWLCRPNATRKAEPERLVAIKELRIGTNDAPDDGNPAWKHVELFEREAKVLAMLRHESVPRVIEFFEHPREGGGLGLYLVQEFVDAPSFRQRLEHGPLLGTDEIERLVHGLLDVLEYLHGRAPPVFHRDVKPSSSPGVALATATASPPVIAVLGYGVITFGILPLWYARDQRQRVNRYRRLFIEGSAVLGRIVAVTTSAFEDAIRSNVKFAYQVEGVEYRSFIQYPNKLARYWSEGDSVTVLYDPGDPTDACFVFRRIVR